MTKNSKQNPHKQFLTTSQAVALTVERAGVEVVAAYPISPQTKIIEALALRQAQGAKFEFLRAESEHAAASMALGASATGARAYTATSSQGLLFMLEVLYNIAGLRLPVVLTCANRSVSAPLNIWNDHQDAMAARDTGFLMFFAANSQEAVIQHLLAFKVAEKLKLPAMLNIDGFVLTHASEPVILPQASELKKFLPRFKPSDNNLLNAKNPQTIGHLVLPELFYKFRRRLDEDLLSAESLINKAYTECLKLPSFRSLARDSEIDNGVLEYYGPKQAKIVIVALGSVCGTAKEAVNEFNRHSRLTKAAVLKIKVFRPFPSVAINQLLKNKKIIIINRALSPGALPPLSAELAAGDLHKATHLMAGLGGQEITVAKLLKQLERKIENKIVWLE